jgi:hypothetical protein
MMIALTRFSERDRIYLFCAICLLCLFIAELVVQPIIGGRPDMRFLSGDAALVLYAGSHLIKSGKLRVVIVVTAAALAVAWFLQS